MLEEAIAGNHGGDFSLCLDTSPNISLIIVNLLLLPVKPHQTCLPIPDVIKSREDQRKCIKKNWNSLLQNISYHLIFKNQVQMANHIYIYIFHFSC